MRKKNVKTKKDEENEIILDSQALAHTLSSAQGRQTLWYVLQMCGVYKLSFTGSSETFFREGRRSVGLQLLKLIQKEKPEAYRQMEIEASNRKEFFNE